MVEAEAGPPRIAEAVEAWWDPRNSRVIGRMRALSNGTTSDSSGARRGSSLLSDRRRSHKLRSCPVSGTWSNRACFRARLPVRMMDMALPSSQDAEMPTVIGDTARARVTNEWEYP